MGKFLAVRKRVLVRFLRVLTFMNQDAQVEVKAVNCLGDQKFSVGTIGRAIGRDGFVKI